MKIVVRPGQRARERWRRAAPWLACALESASSLAPTACERLRRALVHRHLPWIVTALTAVAATTITTLALRACVVTRARAGEEVRRGAAQARAEVLRAQRDRDDLSRKLEESEHELWRERQREVVPVPQPPPRWRVPLRWGVLAAVPDEERLCPWVLPVHSGLGPSGSRLESGGGDTR